MSKLVEALFALGDTKEEVAASLRAKGIKGLPGRPCDCPVANYLKRLGFGANLRVDVEDVIADGDMVSTPDAVSEFIREFDSYNGYSNHDWHLLHKWPFRDLLDGSVA